MTKEDPLKNWQLEQRGEDLDQWKLQDTEQDLDKHLQLQEADAAGPQWQPIEYEREARPRRRNWVLPSIVIVALLVVLAYVGWIALGQFGGGSFNLGPLSLQNFNPAQLLPGAVTDTPTVTPTEESAAIAAPTPEPPTPTPEPTATPTVEATATAVPEPTPALAELITGTVNSVGGVNARTEPAITGEIVRLLDQNARVTVIGEQAGWLQVILDDNRVAWVSADFLDRASQQVLVEQLNTIRAAAGLPPVTPAVTVESTPGARPSSEVTMPVTVIGQPGINARSLPAADALVVTALPVSTTLAALGQSADGLWLAVRLPDGAAAWVLTQFVAPEGDVATLPVVDPAKIAQTQTLSVTTPITLAVPGAGAPALKTNGVIPAAPFSNTIPLIGPALAISDTVGVNARSEPTTTAAVLLVIPNGAVLPVVGRTADASWLQVTLPDGKLAWVFAAAANASSDAGTAPVVGAAPAGPTITASVSNPLGSNLRSAPDRNLDPFTTADAGTTLAVIGRSADGEWVKVRLDNGTTAWALLTTVTLDADITSLPVTQ